MTTAAAPPLVMHVIHHLVTGGMENGLVNLINRMAGYRHAVVCVEDYSDFRNRITRPDVPVLALHRSRVGLMRMRVALYRACRTLRPAVVHGRGLSGLDALLPARLAGVRATVHGEHGWDVGDLRGQAFKPRLVRQLHAPLVNQYVAVSRDLQRYLVEQVGISAQRVTHICNGVDTDRFAPRLDPDIADGDEPAWPTHFRGEHLLRIGTVGRIQPVKDQATLLSAFAGLLQARPDWRDRLRLLVVGDGPLLADLRALAGSLGIARQTWLPGAVADVPRVMRRLDVFVLPSLNEGISNTVLEAMACQLPVLATAVGGNVELVSDGVEGLLFGAGDVAALAGHLARCVEDTALRRRLAQAARQRAVRQFSLSAMVAGYQAVYDRLTLPRG